VSQEPGSQQLDLSPTTFNGYPALHWEFLVRESGPVLHEEDEFIVDTTSGDNVAALTQAPESQYAGLASAFAALRDSLSLT
jgi:hypothetical protein